MKRKTLSTTQKSELLRRMNRDLKHEVSLLRRSEYERELRNQPSLAGLVTIERSVRTDPRLSQWDRICLLKVISRTERRGRVEEVGAP